MNNKLAMAVAVVGLSALSFAAVVAVRDRGAAKPEVKATTTKLTSLESVPRIALADLRAKMDRGEVVVMDVRDIDSYTASHIPGALHIPVSYIESELPYLPRGKPIVAYCT